MIRNHGLIALIIIILLIYTNDTFSKENKLPSVTVENLHHKKVDTKTFSNDGKPFLILFWATWCKPCIQELKAVHDLYEDWQDETGVKVIAISIDDSRNSRKVAPFVKGRNWRFEVYIDENSDFKRAMNVNNPPHSFLVDGKGNIVWQHNGYAPGDEEGMYKEVKKYSK